MSLILTIDTTKNKVLSQEQQTNKKVIVDWFSINDTIVVDEETWDICLYEKSSQWLKRLEELSNQKELNDFEIAAWYATSPTFINNPSAIFLSGNNAGNVRAWSNSFGVNKCIFVIMN